MATWTPQTNMRAWATGMVPAFGLGLAALLHSLKNRGVSLRWITAGCVGFVAWNGTLMVRYVLEDIPRSGPVPLGDLVVGQFTALSRYYDRIIQILMTRS